MSRLIGTVVGFGPTSSRGGGPAQQVSYRPVAEVISFIVGLGDFRPVYFNRNG